MSDWTDSMCVYGLRHAVQKYKWTVEVWTDCVYGFRHAVQKYKWKVEVWTDCVQDSGTGSGRGLQQPANPGKSGTAKPYGANWGY